MTQDKFHIEPSKLESKFFSLKIARSNADHLNHHKLYSEILFNEYDVCRLKLPAMEHAVNVKLQSMGFPFSFSGSIKVYRFKTNIRDTIGDCLIYELFTGDKVELLKDLIAKTWGNYPIGYYNTPLLNKLINKEDEIACMGEYFTIFFNNQNFKNNFLWFIIKDNEYIGFVAFRKTATGIDSTIAGVIRNAASNGFFYDIIRFGKAFCNENKLDWGYIGARSENIYSQRAFERENMTSYRTENVYHISSLLSFSKIKPIKLKIRINSENKQVQQELVYRTTLDNLKHKSSYSHYSFKINFVKDFIINNNYTVVINTPIEDNEELLVVTKVYDSTGQLTAFSYLSYSNNHII